jgi:hypothetical protein
MKGPASNLFDILAKEWRELASKRDFAKLIDVAIASKIMLSQLPDSEGPVEAALLALHHSIEMVVFDGKPPKATSVEDPACSFCGRKPPEVRLGAGPSAFICNECVGIFTEVFKSGNEVT